MIATVLSPAGRWIAGGLLILAIGAAAWWRAHDSGREDALNDVEAENAEAAQGAGSARLGYHKCLAADGMHWDFGAGICRDDPPGGR